MRKDADMVNEMHIRNYVDSCHQLFPDENVIESSGIYNLSLEVFDFRRRYISIFVFAHVSINSFRHKDPFIRAVLNKQSVALLAISDSKLDNSFTGFQFQVIDYAGKTWLRLAADCLFTSERTYPTGDWGNSTVRVSNFYF